MSFDLKIPSDADHVLIAANPRAGAGRKWKLVEQLAILARKRGWKAEIVTELGEVTRKANESARRGKLRALIGAGGDGTAAELVNRTEPGVPISLFPMGTENLLARYLQLDAEPAHLIEVLAEGRLARLDAGLAGKRIFLLMVSIGFDADVVHRMHRHRRGHITHWSYTEPIFEAIRTYRYPELRLSIEGNGAPCPATGAAGDHPLDVTARWVFLFNLPCYAAGLPLCPSASGTDGKLDLCAFRRGSLATGLVYLFHVLRGTHLKLKDCVTRTIGKLTITSDEPIPYQLDGDPGGRLPLEIGVLPGRMTVVVPRAWLQSLE